MTEREAYRDPFIPSVVDPDQGAPTIHEPPFPEPGQSEPVPDVLGGGDDLIEMPFPGSDDETRS